MTDEQWKLVTLGIGSGVLNEGGDPYHLTNINNATNQVTVNVSTDTGLAQAIVAGFYHRLDAPVVLNVPAVTSATTYWIVLEYSPLRLEQGEPPVQLKVIAGGSLDTSQGRQYLVLHKFWRRANELLTDANYRAVKPRIAPLLQVRDDTELPEPDTVIRGTVAVVHGDFPDIKIAKQDAGQPVAWVSLLSGKWQTLSDLANTTNFSGSPKQLRRVGTTRYLRGQFYRSNGSHTAYTASGSGYTVAHLDEADLPKRGMRFPIVPVVHGTGDGADAAGYIVVSATNSDVRLYMTRGTCGRIDMGQISWDVD
ncbi:hypothetical protein ACFU1Q_11540 [Brachybacterium paraconglomeratum]